MLAANPTSSSKSAPVSELCVLCVSAFSSPNVDALDAASSLSPLFATLTKNTRGWGAHPSNQNLAVLPAPNHKSPATALVPFLPPVTSHQSRITKSFTIRTYAKRAHNPFTMNTSKTQHLKPFRMNTYEKRGERALVAQASACAPHSRPMIYPERPGPCSPQRATTALLTTHYSLLTTHDSLLSHMILP
jgi:hypothetical protein